MSRIPKSEKAKATLAKMKEQRAEDTRNLRKEIEEKLEWAVEQKKKGIEVMDRQLRQIKENKDMMLQIDGIIKVLTQLLEPEVPETENTKPEELKKD